MRRITVGICSCVFVIACNGILSIDDYRACEGVECDGDASIDAPADTQPDVPVTGCTLSSECPAASPVCSAGACASITSLSRGTSNFQCAVLSDQTARCWGDGNNSGELGNGIAESSITKPVTVLQSTGNQPLPRIRKIVTGLTYACALTHDNDVYCWGTDAVTPDISATLIATTVTDISGAAGVSANEGSVCVIREDGSAACFGYNYAGRLGCSTTDIDAGGNCAFSPTVVAPNSPKVLASSSAGVGAGTYVTCSFAGGSGAFECWGDNSFGGVGNGTTTSSDSCCIDGKSAVSAPIDRLESSDFFTCAQTNNGYWFCWGMSTGGAILNAPPGSVVSSPTIVAAPGTFADFSPGWYHSCAIRGTSNPGTVECWGQNDHGQVGNGSKGANVLTPVTVSTLSGVTQIAAHRNFSCALNGDGNVYCWGQNWGSIGGSFTTSNDAPLPVVVTWD